MRFNDIRKAKGTLLTGIDHGHRLDCRLSVIFRRIDRAHSTIRPSSNGGLIVDSTMMLALLVALVLMVVLTAALLVPEKFS